MVEPMVYMGAFLNAIREHLKKQEEARRYSEQKVTEYIETRAKEDSKLTRS